MLLASVVLLEGMSHSRSNLYASGSSASQRADDQCGEPQGSDPCLQVDSTILGCDRGESEREFANIPVSQLLMSSLGPILQRFVLPTFPCVDYISRGNTGDCTYAPRAAMCFKQCRRLGRSAASLRQSFSRRVSASVLMGPALYSAYLISAGGLHTPRDPCRSGPPISSR